MTRQLAVLGSPIAHSKSPEIHSAAYRTLGLNWQYSKVEVAANHLLQFLETLDSDWLGLSLTMPLKEEAARLANESSPLVQATRVANTLLRTTVGWKAFNTDVFGISQALANIEPDSVKSITILGSGATATSAVFAVANSFSGASIRVLSRNRQTAAQLQKLAEANGIKIKIAKLARFASRARRSNLVISTLPGGAIEDQISKLTKRRSFGTRATLLDVAYDPWPSALATLWRKSGAEVISGVEMLLWQAIAQIRIFSHNDIDEPLPNERAVELAMRHALGLI